MPANLKTTLAKLTALQKTLPQDHLAQFVVFNNAYVIVTQTIKQAIDRGYFKNPEFIEKLIVCFAHYYFEAVDMTLRHDPKLTPAWALLDKAGKAPRFIQLLMGANAHIKADLPLALLDLHSAMTSNGFVNDVRKIDRLLLQCGREILTTFDEPNRTLDFGKRHLRFLYYHPVMLMILWWRIHAWRSYRSLKKHGVRGNNYLAGSTKTAHHLLWLAKCLG